MSYRKKWFSRMNTDLSALFTLEADIPGSAASFPGVQFDKASTMNCKRVGRIFATVPRVLIIADIRSGFLCG